VRGEAYEFECKAFNHIDQSCSMSPILLVLRDLVQGIHLEDFTFVQFNQESMYLIVCLGSLQINPKLSMPGLNSIQNIVSFSCM